jgi:hypothetical protein
MKELRVRFHWKLYLCFLGAVFITFFTGCNNNNQSQEQLTKMKTDMTELARFISLPEGVIHGEWQTGEYPTGNDWWLAVTLNFDEKNTSSFLKDPEGKELIETPNSLVLESSFAALKSLSGTVVDKEQGILRLLTNTYSVSPYISSPLNNGKVIKLSDTQVMVYLWTN